VSVRVSVSKRMRKEREWRAGGQQGGGDGMVQQGAYAWQRGPELAWEQLELGGAVQVQGRAVQ
jgi:hypothetical protein